MRKRAIDPHARGSRFRIDDSRQIETRMSNSLWLIPALPLAGALVLILSAGRIRKPLSGLIGCGSVGLSAVAAFIIGLNFASSGEQAYHQVLWSWFNTDGLTPDMGLYLDRLTTVFIFVITFVGFLIHVYSMGYMADDEGYTRFFAYLNLFVFSMLMLVMADNLVLLYLGWEGVGLCSYLLIGFWYKEEKNGYAARKAFII